MVNLTDYIDKIVKQNFPNCTGICVGENTIICHGLSDAESQQAYDMVIAYRIVFQKELKIQEIKAEAARRIEDTLPDWKVSRHRDQIELGVPTTLTAEEYALKQQKKQALRDASNTIEAEILALSDVDAVINFDITNHPAWPVE